MSIRAHSQRERLIRVTLCLLCGLGAYVCGELVKHHAGPWPAARAAGGLLGRFCADDTDDDGGCHKALESNYGAIDIDVPVVTGGFEIRRTRVEIPVAFLGLGYFVLLGSWFGLAGPAQGWGRWAWSVPMSLALGGCAASVGSLGLMVFVLRSVCTLCLATHAINLLVLVGTLHLGRRSGGGSPAGADPIADASAAPLAALRPVVAARILGFGCLVITGLWLYREAKLDVRRAVAKLLPYKQTVIAQMNDPGFLLREFFASPVQPAADPARAALVDADGDRAALVVFGDFECPHCACFAARWSSEFSRFWTRPPGVEFRHFPLCAACNPSIKGDAHAHACRAAAAAEAIRLQGGDAAFWKAHDFLFGHSVRPGGGAWDRVATVCEVDPARLRTDMVGPLVRRRIAADAALARQLGVEGTPAVFLGGRRVPARFLFNPVFWQAVAQADIGAHDQGRVLARQPKPAASIARSADELP